MHYPSGFWSTLQHSGQQVRARYRMKLYWMGLDDLDRASMLCSVILIGTVFGLLAIALGVF
jgi:hypothetical protein